MLNIFEVVHNFDEVMVIEFFNITLAFLVNETLAELIVDLTEAKLVEFLATGQIMGGFVWLL